MSNWVFEFNVPYDLTEYSVILLAYTVVVIGFEIRPSVPSVGGCFGVVVLGKWFGWMEDKS